MEDKTHPAWRLGIRFNKGEWHWFLDRQEVTQEEELYVGQRNQRTIKNCI